MANRSEADADAEIRATIDELIAVMYNPIQVIDIPTTRDASSQAGYWCITCNVVFHAKDEHDRHKSLIHERYRYTCMKCGVYYVRLCALVTHIERVHESNLSGPAELAQSK